MNPKAKKQPGIPRPALQRLPIYYRRLSRALDKGTQYLSSTDLAQSADVSEAQVRKDLSHLDLYGRPGVGYNVKEIRLLPTHISSAYTHEKFVAHRRNSVQTARSVWRGISNRSKELSSRAIENVYRTGVRADVIDRTGDNIVSHAQNSPSE